MRGEVFSIQAQEQLEYLIETYENLVFTICYRLTGNYFDSQDLTQETFLAAYRHLSRFDGRNEKAWVTRIATNKCIDYLKRAGRGTYPTEDTFFLQLQTRGPTVEEHIIEQEVRTQLFEHCQLLREPYREIALLYFHQELTFSEIAEKTGKNLKTIQTQVYRAKAMLKKIYEKEGYGHGKKNITARSAIQNRGE